MQALYAFSSVIVPVVTAILVGSAPRHLNMPQNEALGCPPYSGKSRSVDY